MKRLVVCIMLIAFVISTAAVSTFVIRKRADELITELERVSDLLKEKAFDKAVAQAEQTEAIWKKSSLAFFILLDHQTFSELDILMPQLKDFLTDDPKTAKEQLIRCKGILCDILVHQRVSPGNIL